MVVDGDPPPGRQPDTPSSGGDDGADRPERRGVLARAVAAAGNGLGAGRRGHSAHRQHAALRPRVRRDPLRLTQGRPLTLNEIGATFVQGDTSACARHDDRSPPLFPDKNVYLAVITSMFLHGGWLHLGFNMLFLWVFGNKRRGPARLGALPLRYLLAGIFATGWPSSPSTRRAPCRSSARPGRSPESWAHTSSGSPERRSSRCSSRSSCGSERSKRAWCCSSGSAQPASSSTGGGAVAWMAHVAGFGFGMMGRCGRCGRGRSLRRSAIRGRSRRTRTAEDRVGETRARSPATIAGVGSIFDRSWSLRTMPERTSPKAQPNRTANNPSVSGRSPTIRSGTSPTTSRTSAAMAGWGLPATTGSASDPVATAARIAPPPGIGPSGVG